MTIFALFILAALAGFNAPIFAQGVPAIQVGRTQITGVPEDWTHHHVAFSDPGSEQDAIKAGKYDQWQKIVNDPRYVIQQLKRNTPVQGPAAADANYRAQWISEAFGSRSATLETPGILAPPERPAGHPERPIRVGGRRGRPASSINTDWNESVGTATSNTGINFPAKWSFATGTESCTGDFVIYPTGQVGSTTQATILAYYNLYSECGGTVPSVDWEYNTGTGDSVTLAPVFSLNGSQAAFIQSTGGTAYATTTTGSTSFTVTSGALSSSEVGLAVTGAGIPAGDTIATVTGTTTGTLTTAATTGGTGVTLTIGTASLVLLRYALITSGSGSLTTLTSQTSAANYYNGGTGCTAPCMYTIAFNGSTNDIWSDPFYDYTDDALYVGDAVGKLHKFSPVFRGAPAEAGGPWPVQMARGATTDANQLASPVYDTISGYIFVGSTIPCDSSSTSGPAVCTGTTGGYFYSVKASSGAINGYSSTQLDEMYGIRDAPLFDPVAEEAYVSASYNTSGDSAVYQFSATGFSGSTAPAASATIPVSTGETAGADDDNVYMYSGTFDNTYYTSSSGASPTGYLYVCPSYTPATLYQIAITSGTMATTAIEGPDIGDGSYWARCSPLTEFYNANAPEAATGTITIASNPSGWAAGQTVTVGATTYTFVTGAPTAANEVELYTTSFSATTNEDRTADNLEAVIDDATGDCAPGDGACVYTGQTANASASATLAGAVLTLTAKTSGAGGDFTLTSSTAGDIAVSGGSNGVTGEDLLILSEFASSATGCTESDTNGCVMSFNITTPTSWSTTTAPLGTLNVASPEIQLSSATNPSAATSGIIVDNNGTAAGQSNIYFLTQDYSSTACVSGGAAGICAIQATQAAP